ncbi:hypothetical protein ABNQ38_07700 (plasmid) [Azospirillum sp. A29]|uniref:hypothetical protein n=1 Tax=Azospirillum sp. A29 TaxID=3160606 RepID=UPI003670D4A6
MSNGSNGSLTLRRIARLHRRIRAEVGGPPPPSRAAIDRCRKTSIAALTTQMAEDLLRLQWLRDRQHHLAQLAGSTPDLPNERAEATLQTLSARLGAVQRNGKTKDDVIILALKIRAFLNASEKRCTELRTVILHRELRSYLGNEASQAASLPP